MPVNGNDAAAASVTGAAQIGSDNAFPKAGLCGSLKSPNPSSGPFCYAIQTQPDATGMLVALALFEGGFFQAKRRAGDFLNTAPKARSADEGSCDGNKGIGNSPAIFSGVFPIVATYPGNTCQPR